ncbi:hypothetical protein JCM6882_008640 [Rhodosporidiobolus microsporus]
MAPSLETLSPSQVLATSGSVLGQTILFFACYIALKLLYSTYISPRFSPLRDVPGPKPSAAWSGAMQESFSYGPGVAFAKWVKQFGGAVRFPVYFGKEHLVLTDPGALNHMFVKRSYEYVKPPLNAALIGDIAGDGLLVVEGDDHRRHKKLMVPAFSPAHLRELLPILFDKSKKVRDAWTKLVETEDVDPVAFKTAAQAKAARRTAGENGEKEAFVEVHSWFNKLTLDIIGLAGFGYSFDTLSAESTTLSSTWDAISTRVASVPTPWSFLYTRILRALALAGRSRNLDQYIPNARVQADRRLRVALEKESRGIIEEKIRETEIEGKEGLQESKDLIALLLRANWGESKAPLSTEELRAEMMNILLAGHETTSNQLAWTLHYFTRYPDVQTKLRDELRAALKEAQDDGREELDYSEIDKLEYLDAVVNESLRVEPSIPITTRQATTDDHIPLSRPIPSATHPGSTISSIAVKKGQQFVIPIYAANRNRDLFGEDADEFRPERWLEKDEKGERIMQGGSGHFGAFTFLQGPRSCIGYKLANMELKVALAVLLPVFTFAPRDANTQIERRAELVTRSLIVGEEEMGPRMVLKVGLAQ